jgi:hypothetical protein
MIGAGNIGKTEMELVLHSKHHELGVIPLYKQYVDQFPFKVPDPLTVSAFCDLR